MIGGFHNRMRNMVIRQLAYGKGGKGNPVDFKTKTKGVFNPATGKVEGSVESVVTGSGVRVNYSESSYKDATIQHGDFQLYLSPVLLDGSDAPVPRVGDRLTFLGKSVDVIKVSPFNDNGLDCGWKLQVRYG